MYIPTSTSTSCITHTNKHSLGGFLVARYAQLHPGRVERLVMLCPGFDRCSRWEKLFGAAALKEWEEVGYREFEVRFEGVVCRYRHAYIRVRSFRVGMSVHMHHI